MDHKKPYVKKSWRSHQAGMSISSMMIAVAIGSIIALVIASLTRQMVHRRTEVDLENDLSSIRGEISSKINCEETLSEARDSLGIGSNQALCDARRSNSSTAADYNLSNNHPLRLVFKGKSTNRFATSDIDNSDNYAPFGEGWKIQVGCDWSAKSLIIKAKRTKKDITGKQHGDILVFGDPGAAPSLCRKEIMDAAPQPPEPSQTKTSEVRYANTRENNSANAFEFDLDPKFRMVEIRIHGEWEGSGDLGADIFSESILVNLITNRFSGTQMIKIGSDSIKSRVAIWKDAQLTSTMTLPPLTRLKSGACQFSDDVYPARCYPNLSYANSKFPQPFLQCGQYQGSRCVKIRYKSRIPNGDGGGSSWWALSAFIRKF
jgi:hypothetical protein